MAKVNEGSIPEEVNLFCCKKRWVKGDTFSSFLTVKQSYRIFVFDSNAVWCGWRYVGNERSRLR